MRTTLAMVSGAEPSPWSFTRPAFSIFVILSTDAATRKLAAYQLL